MGYDFKYKDLTEQIIGCAMRVHSTLGNGFQEVIYQRCLEIELANTALPFSRELTCQFIIMADLWAQGEWTF